MTLIATVEALLPAMAGRASMLDVAGAFPADDVDALRQAGALRAPLSRADGGLAAGTAPDGAETVLRLLSALGRGNLSVARLFEAHVNALRLVWTFGDASARQAAAADAAAGHLFGLWVTDAPGRAVVARQDRLEGEKGPCSGAGHCTRALVTASTAAGTRMAVVALSGGERVVPITGLHGMRAAVNGVVDLTGVPVRDWIGDTGAYLREPDFSCGAWRASAAAAGALESMVAALGAGLRARGLADAPMQLARFGQAVTARETARLWVRRMADAAERDGPVASRVAAVNLGRLAVERACLDAMTLTQRSLGLAAFVAPNPVERIGRDLATYLRQPAPDAVLLEAAAWHLEQL